MGCYKTSDAECIGSDLEKFESEVFDLQLLISPSENKQTSKTLLYTNTEINSVCQEQCYFTPFWLKLQESLQQIVTHS